MVPNGCIRKPQTFDFNPKKADRQHRTLCQSLYKIQNTKYKNKIKYKIQNTPTFSGKTAVAIFLKKQDTPFSSNK